MMIWSDLCGDTEGSRVDVSRIGKAQAVASVTQMNGPKVLARALVKSGCMLGSLVYPVVLVI